MFKIKKSLDRLTLRKENLVMNKLQQWVEDYGGMAKLAWKLGVHVSSVQHWLTGRSHPKLPTAQRIVQLSKYHLDYDEIIECTKRPEGGFPERKTRKKTSPHN
jgi:DNA-binding phage protein